MQAPKNGNGEGKIMAEINIIPLVDISLVLLIIFMVTTAFVKEAGGVRSNCPGKGAPVQPVKPSHAAAQAAAATKRTERGSAAGESSVAISRMRSVTMPASSRCSGAMAIETAVKFIARPPPGRPR